MVPVMIIRRSDFMGKMVSFIFMYCAINLHEVIEEVSKVMGTYSFSLKIIAGATVIISKRILSHQLIFCTADNVE